jgi:ubiquinol-cytochrome c reductase cytochrome b subunit
VATVLIAAFSTLVLIFLGYQEPWKPNLGVDGKTVPSLSALSYQHLPATAQQGARLMHAEACLACHQIGNVGGLRGPDLTYVANRYDRGQLIWRIARGGRYAAVRQRHHAQRDERAGELPGDAHREGDWAGPGSTGLGAP